jgi:polysaccharide biosynthesis/export protein
MQLERLFPLKHHQPSTMVTGEPRITLLYQVIVKIAPEFYQWTMARKDFSTVVRNSVSVVLTVVSGLWLASLTAAPALAQKESAPTPPANSAAPGRSDASTAPVKSDSGVAVDPKTYVIGAQDVLSIKVWREQDFTGLYTVRPDGKITLPLIGDVQASGLTPERLGDQLKQGLSNYINSPDVSVSLQTVGSKKFYITGEVNRPGEYVLAIPTKVFDALSNSGGFRDFANKKKIIIIRGTDRLKFNYQDILKGKNLEQNIFLENGDTVVVP